MNKKILIVDDEPNIVTSLQFLLQQNGYEVDVAQNGVEALQKIEVNVPNLVLLDVMMPVMDGFEVSKRIRENSEWDEVCIIYLTAKGRQEDKVKGYAKGADMYITKPFSTRDLVEQVNDMLEHISI
ncbi:MAG: response regulator [Chitinophagales bacterium]